MPAARPPLRLWFVKLWFSIIGRYPCTACKKFFPTSQWKEWGGEPSVDQVEAFHRVAEKLFAGASDQEVLDTLRQAIAKIQQPKN